MKKIVFICFCLFLFVSSYASDKVKVACVGNSITYGTGIKDRDKHSYPSQLQSKLGVEYLVGNFGRPGATLLNKGHRPYIEQSEYKEALDFKADIVVIHLGVNDTDPRNWPDYRDDFVKDYVSLINSFKGVNPKARIIIAGITPIWDRHPRFQSGTKVWQDDIRSKIDVVAEVCDAELVDFYTPLHSYPFMFPDAIHPNEEGAAVLAQIVYSAITGNYGGLKVSDVFGDNMVLQRDMSFSLSGTSDAGDNVVVMIDGRKYATVTGKNGRWSVDISPLSAKRNIELSISNDSKKIEFKNVAVGDVWLCSGQSNMEFMLKNSIGAEKEINKSECSDIRLFDMKAEWRTDAVEWPESALDSVNHLDYYRKEGWKECNPKSARDFSAVAYYFGKMLHDSIGVPIGLICNAVGGSTTESWIDRETLETEFYPILKDWRNNDFIQKWARDRASLNIRKSKSALQRHPYEPCYLFESGILPLGKYPIKGVIWYQGESNAHNMEAHDKLFRLLVNSWRKNWSNDSMPFYFVQLSSLNRPSWPWFRDSQRRLMYEIPYTGMAVSSDYGDSLDVHPRNKRPVGERLARWALADTYGYSVLPSGPLFRKAVVVDNMGGVSVEFEYSEGLAASNNRGKLVGFELAEFDGMFYPADAEIKDNNVILHSSEVNNPKYVRYGWQPFTKANLVNSEGLPASTFRGEVDNLSVPEYPVEKGVSAPFAGIIGDWMIVAGGCNFPDIPAADGGRKVYYNDIYALNIESDDKEWILAGRLPENMAYGASVTVGDAIYIIGGENEKGILDSAYKITFDINNHKAVIDVLPALPEGITNLSGTVSGNRIYVSGGLSESNINSMYSLPANSPLKWEKMPSYPGSKRIQSILLADGDGMLYLVGGFQSPDKRKGVMLSDDVLGYDIEAGQWKKISDLPHEDNGEKRCLVGAGGVSHNGMLVLTGGVNYSIFADAINGKAPADYLRKPVEWYKFNDDILFYNTKENNWTIMNDIKGMSKAGGILLFNNGCLYMICGEIKPGIRCNEIVAIPLKFIFK